MKRREFLKSAATCAAIAAAPMLSAAKKSAGAVRGKVVKGGRNGTPAVGVVVTDGLQCVRTDEKGEFPTAVDKVDAIAYIFEKYTQQRGRSYPASYELTENPFGIL